MTYSFIQAIERGQGTTYGGILNSMRSTITTNEDGVGGGTAASLLTMLLTGGSLSGMRQVQLAYFCQLFSLSSILN